MYGRNFSRKALLLAIFAMPAASLAAAPGTFETKTVTVSYADLDIHTIAGAKELYTRMKRASKSACGFDSYRKLGSLDRIADAKACYEDALDEFVARVDSDELRSLHPG